MRLVRIRHIRCGEWEGARTYVLAPSEWSDEVVDREVQQACDAYLDAYTQALSKEPPPFRPLRPDYDSNPDRIVADVRAEFEQRVAEWKAWDKRRALNARRFEDFLGDRGFKRLWEAEEGVEVKVDWGHRHGQRLVYGEDDPDGFPRPTVLAGDDEPDEF